MPHSLEPFAGQFQTADGFSLLAGGLCPTGCGADALQALSALNQLSLGPSKDCVVIDVRLGQMLRQAVPDQVRFLAASVYVPGAPELCGGVAGDILCEEDSADGSFAHLVDDWFGFALPGAGAMFLMGDESAAHSVYRSALQDLTTLPLSRDRIRTFLDHISSFPTPFLLVTDGSGGSAGCLCIQTAHDRSVFWLPLPAQNSCTRGDFYG